MTDPAPDGGKWNGVRRVVLEVLGQYEGELTVRQVYYRLVSDPYTLFPNTRSSYVHFDHYLTRWREDGSVPADRFVDRGRAVIGGEGTTWSDPAQYLRACHDALTSDDYQLSRWEGARVVPEVWVEKDALATVIQEAVAEWGVRVFATRGYSSYTKLIEGVVRLGATHRIIYLSDHDPSGVQMEQDLGARMERYGSPVEIHRVALTTAQVRRHRLAANPVKRSDTRAARYIAEFGEKCWELDALPPDVLRKTVRAAVEPLVDKKRRAEIGKRERREREEIDDALETARAALEDRLGETDGD